MGARLCETTAHLFLLLWDTAMVNTGMGLTVGLNAAVVGAAVRRLRPFLMLRRFARLLRVLLRCGLLMLLRCGLLVLLLCGLLMLFLGGPALLMLLSLLRSALLPALFVVLCVGRGRGSEKQEQNCCSDNARSLHICAPFCAEVGLRKQPSTQFRQPRDTPDENLLKTATIIVFASLVVNPGGSMSEIACVCQQNDPIRVLPEEPIFCCNLQLSQQKSRQQQAALSTRFLPSLHRRKPVATSTAALAAAQEQNKRASLAEE
jgi:hypothetical protein